MFNSATFQVIGNIGNEQVTTFPNGKSKVVLSVCAEDVWYDDQGELQSRKNWIDIVLWNNLGLSLRNRIGSTYAFEGLINKVTWKDEAGNDRSRLELVCRGAKWLRNPNRDGGDYETQEVIED